MKDRKELSDNIKKGKQSEKELLANALESSESQNMMKIQWENAGRKEAFKGEAADHENTWDGIRKRIEARGGRRFRYRRLRNPFLRIAASLLLLTGSFLLGSLLKNDKPVSQSAGTECTTIENPAMVRSEVVLPDDSKVNLGPSSRITYNEGFGEDHRKIQLSGKAGFTVSHDQDLPFIVSSRFITVEATGTAFIIAENEEITLASLVEGRVEVTTPGGIPEALVPGVNTTLVFSENSLSEERELSEGDVSWTTGVLGFESAPLGYLCRELESWYGIQITVPEYMENKYAFKIKIRDESFGEIKKLLSLAAPIEIASIEDDKYIVTEKNNN